MSCGKIHMEGFMKINKHNTTHLYKAVSTETDAVTVTLAKITVMLLLLVIISIKSKIMIQERTDAATCNI